MSNKEQKDTGGPAYPVIIDGDPSMQLHSSGITTRDYFAIHATESDITAHMRLNLSYGGYAETREQSKYRFADAMIKERNKG